jgi:hypothetical protein
MLEIIFLSLISQAPMESKVSEEFIQEFKQAAENYVSLPTEDVFGKGKKSDEVVRIIHRYEVARTRLHRELPQSFDEYAKIVESRDDLGGKALQELAFQMISFCRYSSMNYQNRGLIIQIITKRMIDPNMEVRNGFEDSAMGLIFSRILESVEGENARESLKNVKIYIDNLKKAEAEPANSLARFKAKLQMPSAEMIASTLDAPWSDADKMQAYCDRFFKIADPQSRGINMSDIKSFAKKMEKQESKIAPDAKAFSTWMMELIMSGVDQNKELGIGQLLKLQDEIVALIQYMDTDKSGRASNDEAKNFFLSTLYIKDEQTQTFKWVTAELLDTNADGFVSDAEFRTIYSSFDSYPPILQRALKKRFLVVR